MKILSILIEAANANTVNEKMIKKAIQELNPISFYYSGPRKPKKDSVKAGMRIKAEIVAMGLNKKGNLVVRAFVDKPSASKRGTPSAVGQEKSNYGWRTFLVSRMSRLELHSTETIKERPFFNKGGDTSLSRVDFFADFDRKLKKAIKPEKPKGDLENLAKKVTQAVKAELPKPKQAEKPTKIEKPVSSEKPEPARKPEPPKEEPKTPEPNPEKLLEPKPVEKPTTNPNEPSDLEKKAQDAISNIKSAFQLKQPSKKEKPSLSLTDIAKEVDKENNKTKK